VPDLKGEAWRKCDYRRASGRLDTTRQDLGLAHKTATWATRCGWRIGCPHQLRHDLAISSDVRTVTVEGPAYALWSLEAPALPDRRWRWLTLDEGTRAQFETKVGLLLAHAREVHAP
jgi:hypothetical protein